MRKTLQLEKIIISLKSVVERAKTFKVIREEILKKERNLGIGFLKTEITFQKKTRKMIQKRKEKRL